MQGKISQWKDDKGFGFITPDNGSEKVFFHISSMTTKTRRPIIGDSVIFQSSFDKQGRLKATSVAIEGLVKTGSLNKQTRPIESCKKSSLDYIFILVAICSIGFAGFDYFRSGNLEHSLPFGIPAIVAFILLKIPKKPKSKSFNCSRCKKIELFDSRTIQAWNNGVVRLYCKHCHLQWLRDNPRQDHNQSYNKSGGCLGSALLIISVPIIGGFSFYQWFV